MGSPWEGNPSERNLWEWISSEGYLLVGNPWEGIPLTENCGRLATAWLSNYTKSIFWE